MTRDPDQPTPRELRSFASAQRKAAHRLLRLGIATDNAILRELREDGETRRGIPADYAGDDPTCCNARTRSGRPCRAMGLPGTGRCKWHGGLSTGPQTPEGMARALANLALGRKRRWM